MNHTSRVGGRRTTVLILTLTLAVALLAAAAPAAFAAGSYTGGADDYPLFVANDYSASAFHLTASGLTASTTYYVKVRFAVGLGPSGTTNRGWTWNPGSGQWAQERTDDWTAFPQVVSDATGAITGNAGWFYAAFGDTTKTGPYYVLISLSTGGTGETVNGTLAAPVTVMDMTTSGAWVHNGVATGVTAAKRAEADDEAQADPLKVYALSKTEPNGVDDDGNGVVDDEDYGPPGNTGDFRFAVPLSTEFDIALGSGAPWAPAQNVTLSTPDVDIALGATDQTPPTAPTGLTATPHATTPLDGNVSLSWTAASDAVTTSPTYNVYRWTDAVPIGGAVQYTPRPRLVATTTETSWTDPSVLAKTTYYYLVRAVDGTTNVGPRSNQAQATVGETILTLTATPLMLQYAGSVALDGSLTHAGVDALADKPVIIERSFDGMTWVKLTDVTTSATGGFTATDKPARKTRYRATFAGDDTFLAVASTPTHVGVKVWLSTPNAPRIALKGHGFTAYGFLKPRHTAGGHAVYIRCYRKSAGSYRLVKTVRATNRNYSMHTKYVATVSLPYAGSWRLRAYAPADSRHLATLSNYRSVTVR
jgi:hypothetical protein